MKLAINGGKPVRQNKFPYYNVIGDEEKKAVGRVLDSGVLSRYIGCWHPLFLGGPEVQALEAEWADYFNIKHAIAVNSCTSGLYSAVGAIKIEPGDEVIVSPYTMTASVTGVIVFNGIPVFADIEEDYFCIDPKSLERRIGPRTKAIIAVDLFGHPYDVEAINDIARKHDLYVIEDAAQAPGAKYKEQFAGTLGDIGIYSLNYHKHIHCGEGGMVVTNDDELADRIRLIRNHGEAVVEGMGCTDIVNIIGFNFRMPEIEAAITRCQLEKLETLVAEGCDNALYLSGRIGEIPAIIPPKIRKYCTHSYYGHAFRFNESVAGVSRDRFIDAVIAELAPTEKRENEGPLLSAGYVKPLYLQSMFQQKIAYGSGGFPFTLRDPGAKPLNYEKDSCPVVERMHEKELFVNEIMRPGMSRQDLDDVATAFEKVWENRFELMM